MPRFQIIKIIAIIIFVKLVAVFVLVAFSRTRFDPDALFAYAHLQTVLLFILLIRKAKIDIVPINIAPLFILRYNAFLCLFGAAIIGIALRMVHDGFSALDAILFEDASIQEIKSELLQHWHNSRGISGMSILAAVVGSFEEEIVYRLILFSVIEKAYGARVAVIMGSSIFAAMHFDPYVLIVGVVLSLLYLYRRNILLPMLAHLSGNIWHSLIASFGVDVAGGEVDMVIFIGYFAITLFFMFCFVILTTILMIPDQKWERSDSARLL